MIRYQQIPAAKPKPRSAALLAWYDRHRRDLPWRVGPGEVADPYRVWLSEIMLQQTTVKAVAPYYRDFLKRWPTVDALAEAPREDVMKAWAGLGYYSRARNLHACAQVIADVHDRQFPRAAAELKKLPGIGDYTAAAIAAIAFNAPETVVDGNVERVIARLYALETPLPAAKKEIRKYTSKLTDPKRPGDFAQAMMDLGATICTPKRPACALCPFMEACVAHALGRETEFPVKPEKKPRPQRKGVAYWVRRDDGAVLLRKRPDKGLLGGMTEIPSSPFIKTGDPAAGEGAPFVARWQTLSGHVRHIFTHFELTLTLVVPESVPETLQKNPAQGLWWSPPAELAGEALPSVMRKVVALAQEKGI